jgi:molybdenum cofactor cytidylyltransferase
MIVGVLLAAGCSRRFGAAQKLVAMLEGVPVVRRSAEILLASGVHQAIVVVGSDADAVREALAGLPMTFASNERYVEGMGGSLRVGVQGALALADSAGEPVDAIVVALGDQPTIAREIAPAVIERFRGESALGVGAAQIVAARYDGERSHPVLFARSVFPELLAVSGDQGARDVIAQDPSRVAYVEVAGGPPADVDSPRDLETLARQRQRPLR